MAHAPSAVTYPVNGVAWARSAGLCFAGLWCVSQTVWAVAWWERTLPGAWWAALSGAALLGAWMLWQARHAPIGQLSWIPPHVRAAHTDALDTQAACWRWESAAYRRGVPLVGLRCVLDLQSVVLVRASTAAGLGLWLWLTRDHEPDLWGRLREALRHDHRV